MKEGSTPEILAKTISKFIVQNPNREKMTKGEYKEMLVFVGAFCLHVETSGFPKKVQKEIGKEYINMFELFFNRLVDNEK